LYADTDEKNLKVNIIMKEKILQKDKVTWRHFGKHPGWRHSHTPEGWKAYIENEYANFDD